MPIAVKPDLELEDCHGLRLENAPTYEGLDFEQLKEIRELIEKAQILQDEERESRRSIEKLTKANEMALEQVEKGEKKKETLRAHLEQLRIINEDMDKKMQQEKDYHKKHASILDVKELDEKHYELAYEKCVIGLKYDNQLLRIVSQDPEIFNEEQLTDLNVKLNSQCTNYGSAIVLIGKAIKNLSP